MPISVNVAMNLSPNALTVLQKRYLRKDKDGQLIETPADLFRRVARAVAAADQLYTLRTEGLTHFRSHCLWQWYRQRFYQ